MPAFIGVHLEGYDSLMPRDFHKWHLEGKKVKVMYLGEYPAVGTVKSSRVCYGGAIKHWVELDEPIFVNFDSDEGKRRDAVYILEHWKAEENELLEIL